MLQGMISRGSTVFVTSHVLEIVERLCTHIGIIHRGELVAQGSLEELRAGTVNHAPRIPMEPGHPAAALTLEQIFLKIVGSDRGGNAGVNPPEQELAWLK